MQSLLAAGVPVASSCFGDGVCGKCRLQITAGRDRLAAPNEREAFLAERFKLEKDERVSCQVNVDSDIAVDATYW